MSLIALQDGCSNVLVFEPIIGIEISRVDVDLLQVVGQLWHKVEAILPPHHVVVRSNVHHDDAGDDTKQKARHNYPRFSRNPRQLDLLNYTT